MVSIFKSKHGELRYYATSPRLIRLVSHHFSLPLKIFYRISIASFIFLACFATIIYSSRLSRRRSAILDFPRIQSKSWLSRTPTIEIFAAPPPLNRDTFPSLRRAVQSWRSLKPRPYITLLGRSDGLSGFARRQHVRYDPHIDTNFLGRPLFNSLILRANRSKADVTVFINSDVVLLQDFVSNIHKLYRIFPHFFAVGARYDIDEFPDKRYLLNQTIRKYIQTLGSLHNYGGMDFWAWSTNGPRLVSTSVPPFIYARGRYDNWLMHEVIKHGTRPVVDLSETVISIHERHKYNSSVPLQAVALALAPSRVQSRLENANKRTSSTAASNFWSRGKLSNFELFLNIHLSLTFGSYRDGFGTTRHTPWKMVSCYEEERICLLRRKRPGLCFCEYAPQVRHSQQEAALDSHGRPITFQIRTKDDSAEDYELPVQVTRDSARNPHFGLPLTLLDALATVMRNGTVVLSAVNYGYREVMMTWVCHMRRLNIQNFIIAALDKKLYRYAFARGIAVYYEDSFNKGLIGEGLEKEGHYGSDQFRKLTKMKTRVVTRILRLGYDVIWSDCDIVFFKNPVPILLNMSGDLVVQSNAPDEIDPNGIRRINSGFYLARSSEKLIQALDTVVDIALRSNLTEQPCFYDVLCGAEGEFREGKRRCIRGSVETSFLDRREFPNGVTGNIWDTPDGQIRKHFPDAIIVHNNWVAGIATKQNRLRRHGFDIYDLHDDVCLFDLFEKPFAMPKYSVNVDQ